ncbi:MAG: mercury methylation corrinoid protein HgcA [Desulfobacterales bacterium]
MNGIQIQEHTFDRPTDMAYPFADGTIDTPVGSVLRVKTVLENRDRWGAVGARTGLGRSHYTVLPGLYGVGNPDADAPVLVTANYKLTFDILRSSLVGIDTWILVLDTKGINVWCAAGKETFSTTEVVRMVKRTELDGVVSHRKLILPQLSATGVSAKEVKSGSGFRVVWGPIQARHIKPFLEAGMNAEPSMRQVTFTFRERLVLVPVELYISMKPLLYVLSGLLIVSLILHSTAFFINTFLVVIMGLFSGAVLVPLLLPWIPGRSFALKGAIVGILIGILAGGPSGLFEGITGGLSFFLSIIAISSYLAMNFTGSTPFTSPSGVEKEMRRAIPFQLAGLTIAIACMFL